MEDDFVVAGTFNTVFEAELAQATLAAAHIDAILRLDDVGGMIGSFQNVNGVKVLVDPVNLDEAREVLSSRAEELPPEP